MCILFHTSISGVHTICILFHTFISGVHTKTAGRSLTAGFSRTAGLIALASFIIGAVGIVTVCIVKFKDATFQQDVGAVYNGSN